MQQGSEDEWTEEEELEGADEGEGAWEITKAAIVFRGLDEQPICTCDGNLHPGIRGMARPARTSDAHFSMSLFAAGLRTLHRMRVTTGGQPTMWSPLWR